MRAIDTGAVRRYAFTDLEGDGQVIHGAFSRLGGHSQEPFASLNVGGHVGDAAECVAANHDSIYAALKTTGDRVVSCRQVHGSRVALVTPGDGGTTLADTDALISAAPGLHLLLRFADCVPVLLYAPEQRVVALAHAGWQGTLQWIAAKAVKEMVAAYGCRPEGIRAGLGPAIGPCCFEVGPEVVQAFRESYGPRCDTLLSVGPGGRSHIDLWEANALQLREAGVEQIEVTDLCTCCRQDLFYSHRGENGHTGRFACTIGLRAL